MMPTPMRRAAAAALSLLFFSLALAPDRAIADGTPRLAAEGLPRGGGGGGGGAELAAGALVTQSSDATENGLTSQTFTDLPAFSTYLGDDFEVPSGRVWDIRSFHADGAYDSGIIVPDSYTFEILADVAGEPSCGSPVYSVTVNPGDTGVADADGVIDYCPGGVLTSLTAGRYWVSVSVTMDYEFRGQWFWSSHAIPHANGSAAVADNPGGGFGLPPCAPPPGFDYDLAFVLGGDETTLDEKACRAGNVNSGVGAIVNVLTVNGSIGDPSCREVVVAAGVPVTIALASAPAGGNGHYVLWTRDGEPSGATLTPIRYKPQSGVIHELGMGCLCLPANNSVVAESCACSVTFPIGRASQSFGAGTAATYCVNVRPGFPKAPTSFQQTFPAGTFTLGGLIVDSGSASTKPISIMNWIIVRSN
jgi:hypothetical protein